MISLKDSIRKNVANIPGWRTKRKILVIESDDWGSVRIRDRAAYEALKEYGLNVDSLHYDSVESLESNEDLETLFEVLLSIKDCKGDSLKFTPMCVMGNPDFEKIREAEYQAYFFQPLHETLQEYPESGQVLNLWVKGAKQNMFVPEIHGREHINVRRYLKILQSHDGKEGLRHALANHSVGPSAYKSFSYPNYLGALHPEAKSEINELAQYVSEAGALFKTYMHYSPRVFIAPNAEEPRELERPLQQIGVKYLTRSKKRVYPLGDGHYAKEWNFMGQQNELGQTYLNRNAFFEPVTWGEHGHITDWVESCLNDINIAFRWRKPAVISSHRVNYVGSISSKNREKGLKSLKELMSRALKKWPDMEFMTSAELGDLIRREKQG